MHAKIVYLYACTYLLGAYFLCLHLLVFTKFNIILLHYTWNYFVNTQILYCVCLKSKTLRNCLSSSAFLHHFYRNNENSNGEFGAKKYFTGRSTADTIQLFVAIKGIFIWSILFLTNSQRRGIPQRPLDKCSYLFICTVLK